MAVTCKSPIKGFPLLCFNLPIQSDSNRTVKRSWQNLCATSLSLSLSRWSFAQTCVTKFRHYLDVFLQIGSSPGIRTLLSLSGQKKSRIRCQLQCIRRVSHVPTYQIWERFCKPNRVSWGPLMGEIFSSDYDVLTGRLWSKMGALLCFDGVYARNRIGLVCQENQLIKFLWLPWSRMIALA